MSVPMSLSNFPNTRAYRDYNGQFNAVTKIGDWDWSSLGHTSPETITDPVGVTLGSGSAGATDYIQGQLIGSGIRLNRAGKLYEAVFKLTMDSASLAVGCFGLCITNTNLVGTNITDGLGFYTNANGYWNSFIAFDSVTQFTTYTQQLNLAPVTTNEITLGIKILTDANVTGAGSVSWWVNGTQLGYTNTFTTAALPYDENLRLSIASGNGSAVARSCIVADASYMDQV